MHSCDVLVIGAGVVGLAVAYQASRRWPGKRCLVLEKELEPALHQTGRNSGVIHSGIYYRPGSLKAETCVAGRRALVSFCRQHDVPHEVCGKVIVAQGPAEEERLQVLLERGQANGVRCHRITPEQLRHREPQVRGSAAVLVEDAGIADYRSFCRSLLQQSGAELRCQTRLMAIERHGADTIAHTDHGDIKAEWIINCAGLQCDRVARSHGLKPEVKILPFKGEYYRLTDTASYFCNHLVYPVPDPAFPFLGVHLTRMIDGSIEAGPNAVLSPGREAYEKGQMQLGDLAESLLYPGFWRLASGYWRTGLGEIWRSLSKQAFVKALNKLFPELKAAHLLPAPCGIRAQAVDREGRLVDDFRILQEGRVVHVLNAPSPAATASLAIADKILERV